MTLSAQSAPSREGDFKSFTRIRALSDRTHSDWLGSDLMRNESEPMKILIVEDEALIAELVVEHLEEAGHAIIGPAATAGEALDLCRDHTPDLAILDINLQDGSSGIEVARELFARWGLVAIFASGEMLAARQACDVALGYLRKPYEMRALLQSVETVQAMRTGAVPGQIPPGFEAFPHPEVAWASKRLAASSKVA